MVHNEQFLNPNVTTYQDCHSIFDNIVYLPMSQRYIISSVYILLAIINMTINSFAIYVNIKTEQWKNQSTRLFLYISMAEIMSAIFGNTAQVFYILITKHISCGHRCLLRTFVHVFGYISIYMVMFCAVDRYFRVTLLIWYKEKVTPQKFNLLLSLYLAVGTMQGFVLTFRPDLVGKSTIVLYTPIIDVIFMIASFVLYVISIIKLREYDKNSKRISNSTRNLVRLASLYFIILMVTYVPVAIVWILFHKIINTTRDRIVLLLHVCYLIGQMNNLANASVYLYFNRHLESKNVMRSTISV